MLRTIIVENLAVRIIVLDDCGGFRNKKGSRERLLVIPSPASICLLPWTGSHYENQPSRSAPAREFSWYHSGGCRSQYRTPDSCGPAIFLETNPPLPPEASKIGDSLPDLTVSVYNIAVGTQFPQPDRPAGMQLLG